MTIDIKPEAFVLRLALMTLIVLVGGCASHPSTTVARPTARKFGPEGPLNQAVHCGIDRQAYPPSAIQESLAKCDPPDKP
jgi:hypothetical protein